MSMQSTDAFARLARLFQPSSYPYDPADLRGGSIHVDDTVADAHDLVRLLELASKPSAMVWPLLTSAGDLTSQTDWDAYWAANVSTWNAGTQTFQPAGKFTALCNRYRSKDGVMISPLRQVIPQKEGGDLVIWSYLIIDLWVLKCVDRIDLYDMSQPKLDQAIEKMLSSAQITVPYRSPDKTATAYRDLFKTFPIGWACPTYIMYNLWSDWLLYARLVFPEVDIEPVFNTVHDWFESKVIADNLLLNFYGDFTLDANFHAFGTVEYVELYPKTSDMWRYIEKLNARVDQLTRTASSGNQIATLLGAALRDYLSDGGEAYRKLYVTYVHELDAKEVKWVVPTGQDCEGWMLASELNDGVQAVLKRGTLLIGYIDNPPYVIAQSGGGEPKGVDHDLGSELARRIGEKYGKPLVATWTEAPQLGDATGGDPEVDKFNRLYAGLQSRTYDIAMAGQLILPQSGIGTATPQWTGATERIFTAITYTGMPVSGIDMMQKMKAIKSTSRTTFVETIASILNTENVLMTFFSVINPGPSPGSAQNLVDDINAARKDGAPGTAAWVTGTVAESGDVMSKRLYHFTVGDGIANAWQSAAATFQGVYLNIAAVDEPSLLYDAAVRSATLLPVAAFAMKS